ncbi:hypothetical protein L7F22_065642, partial [Adiantum nelumboides]|nr:hypothetical protein [Adiantum nelumboides]
MILVASNFTRMELARRAEFQLDRRTEQQLDKASVNDLLIPSLSYASDARYYVDLMHTNIEPFMTQDQSLSISH